MAFIFYIRHLDLALNFNARSKFIESNSNRIINLYKRR